MKRMQIISQVDDNTFLYNGLRQMMCVHRHHCYVHTWKYAIEGNKLTLATGDEVIGKDTTADDWDRDGIDQVDWAHSQKYDRLWAVHYIQDWLHMQSHDEMWRAYQTLDFEYTIAVLNSDEFDAAVRLAMAQTTQLWRPPYHYERPFFIQHDIFDSCLEEIRLRDKQIKSILSTVDEVIDVSKLEYNYILDMPQWKLWQKYFTHIQPWNDRRWNRPKQLNDWIINYPTLQDRYGKINT